MPRYVALLRGINLGGHTVKMARLKMLFEEMGFKNVETFIASGNVVFDSPAKNAAVLGQKIGAHLEGSLGFPAATFVRTLEQLARVLEHEVFEVQGRHSVYVGFLLEPPSKASHERLMTFRSKTDEFHVGEREVYWLCRSPMMSESPFFRVGLERALGMQVTVRNSTTVAKLVEKYPWKKS